MRRRKAPREPVGRPVVFDGYLNGRRFVIYAREAGASRIEFDFGARRVRINGWDITDRLIERGWMTLDDVPEEHRGG